MKYDTYPEWSGWGREWGLDGSAQRTRILCAGTLAISWGPAETHAVWGSRGALRWQAGQWGPDVRWFVDLELFSPGMAADPVTRCACHIERGFAREEDMWAWVAWLRSCVEVAGEAGLRALNARTGGKLA